MSSRDLCDRRLPFEDAWVTTRSARGARQHAPASQASNQGCSWRLVDLLGSSQTNSGKPSFLEYRVVAGVIDCDNNRDVKPEDDQIKCHDYCSEGSLALVSTSKPSATDCYRNKSPVKKNMFAPQKSAACSVWSGAFH